MPSEAPVGFFDSGIGGISVLRAVRGLLPAEDCAYFGDSLNAPYGTRPPHEILALSRAAAARLSGLGVKALVVACNTATGVALDALSRELPFPVVGIQPALEEAQRLRTGGEVLVMATPATFKTARYAALSERFGEGVLPLPCPGLMEFVEREELEGEALQAFLGALFEPFRRRRVDVVVLGCTHYPFLKGMIVPFFPRARVIDGSGRTAQSLRGALEERDLLSLSAKEGSVTLLSSGGPEAVRRMERFLTRP